MTRTPPAPDIRLVIFDCDGVLVDSEPVSSRTLADLLTDLGFPTTQEHCLANFTGFSLRAVMRKVETAFGRSLPQDFEDQVVARDRLAFAAGLDPMPGAGRMLAALPHARCVASSGAPSKIRRNLALTGLLPFFAPNLFSAREVARGKPAPDLFLHAAASMRTPPSACTVIEDAEAGILAARAAGMRVFGFAGGGHAGPGYAEMLTKAGAERVFRDMQQLPGLLVPPTS